jgi:hypothetical protein
MGLEGLTDAARKQAVFAGSGGRWAGEFLERLLRLGLGHELAVRAPELGPAMIWRVWPVTLPSMGQAFRLAHPVECNRQVERAKRHVVRRHGRDRRQDGVTTHERI